VVRDKLCCPLYRKKKSKSQQRHSECLRVPALAYASSQLNMALTVGKKLDTLQAQRQLMGRFVR
jgi:hypothetical protein